MSNKDQRLAAIRTVLNKLAAPVRGAPEGTITLGHLRDKILEQTGGYAPSTGGGSGRSSTVSDPTGNTATTPERDQAREDLATLDASLVELARGYTAAVAIDRLRQNYLSPRRTGGDPGCDLCRAVKDDHGKPGWSKVHIRGTTVGGILSKPKALCQWHIRFTKAAGRAPHGAEVKRHLRGERVTPPKKKKGPRS